MSHLLKHCNWITVFVGLSPLPESLTIKNRQFISSGIIVTLSCRHWNVNKYTMKTINTKYSYGITSIFLYFGSFYIDKESHKCNVFHKSSPVLLEVEAMGTIMPGLPTRTGYGPEFGERTFLLRSKFVRIRVLRWSYQTFAKRYLNMNNLVENEIQSAKGVTGENAAIDLYE